MGVILGAIVGVTSVAVVKFNLIPKDYDLFLIGFLIGTLYVILTSKGHKKDFKYVLIGLIITFIGAFTEDYFPLDLKFLYGFSIGFLVTKIRREKER